MRLAAGAIALAASGACAAPFGGGDAEPEASPEPRLELSEPAVSLPPSEQPPPADGRGTTTESTSPPTETTEPPAGTSTTAPATTAAAGPRRRLVTLDDLRGDAGLEAPAYADVVMVAMDEAGGQLRLAVDMAGAVPDALEAGEVQGVGIDVFRTGQGESDYQVFLDGGADGWRAYLQTPEGFVEYPGTFAVGGRRLVVQVPWEAVGGRTSGSFSVFCDWSARASPLNRAGSDRAPEVGATPFDPGGG